jgi:RHS repeat-associated protein
MDEQALRQDWFFCFNCSLPGKALLKKILILARKLFERSRIFLGETQAKRSIPVKEESNYYPFGLTMAGISDKALKMGYADNKYRFQKQELQNKEFSDGSGLEMYEFKYRFDDPQIGRFGSIDPLANKYVYNSPYAFSEGKVTNNVELEGLEAGPPSVPSPLPAFWTAVQNEFNQTARNIDHMLTFTSTNDHQTSDNKVSKDVEVKKSVESTTTYNLNFGLGDLTENLTSTNSSAGGPSLKFEIDKSSSDIKDKTTTTAKLGGITITGVESVSRTTGNTENGVTVSGGVNLGAIPNATLGVGVTVDSHGVTTFGFDLSGSTKLNNTTYTTGVSASQRGSGTVGSHSSKVSFSAGTASGKDKNTYSLNINLP